MRFGNSADVLTKMLKGGYLSESEFGRALQELGG